MQQESEVELAQKGSKEAFSRLIKNSEASMYRVAKSFLKTDTDCADAIQETILKAYKMIKSRLSRARSRLAEVLGFKDERRRCHEQ